VPNTTSAQTTTATRSDHPIKSQAPLSVLVVEDDRALANLLEQVLQSIEPRIHVDRTASAEGAIALLKRNEGSSRGYPYDLVLADISLEGERSGIDLWKLCQEKFSRMPIVVTSAMGTDKFLHAIGPNAISPAFLPKPFFIGECRQMLEGMLRYSKSQAS